MAKSNSGEHGKPKRLRPWLENLLNRDETPGLNWIDPDTKTMFRISWKHRGKQDWLPEQSRIFKEWAVQTGRYREGIDDEDYPMWKTRLRCAFNKAPDIEEVRDKRSMDSNEPYRVYRFKSASLSRLSTSAQSDQPVTLPQKRTREALFDRSVPGVQHPPIQRILPSVSNDFPTYSQEWDNQEESCEDESSFKYKIPKLDVMSEYSDNEVAFDGVELFKPSTSESRDLVFDDVKQFNYVDLKPEIKTEFPKLTDIPTAAAAADCETEFQLTVRYCGRMVMQRCVTTQAGCMLCFNKTSLTQLLAPVGTDVIALPLPDERQLVYEKQREFVKDLLRRGLERGLFIQCIGNNIYVHRSCQCATFYYAQEVTPSTSDNVNPTKLRRTENGVEERVCIFDYARYVAALKDYLDGCGEKPDPNCTLVFGQSVGYNKKFDSIVLVSVTVATTRALEDATKADKAMALRTPDINISMSGEFDKFLRQMNFFEKNQSVDEKEEFEFVNIPEVLEGIPEVQYSPENN